MDRKKIADSLKDLRVTKGLSTIELANILGISQQAVSMYECGERIPRDEIKLKYAQYFEVSVSSIFFS